jgi:glycosyltransferase involved in cell wall biosynthesis
MMNKSRSSGRADEVDLSVVIPVYRSAGTIASLVEQLLSEPGVEIGEVVLVNDGSPDDSGAVCRELAERFSSRVCLVDLARNFGEHNAVMAGLNHCRGRFAVIMDDDAQNPPSEIRSLVSGLHSGRYDVVYGKYREKQHNWFRNLGSWFNGVVASVVLRKPREVYLSSFKAISRFVINEITRYQLPYPYIDGLIFRVTDRIGSVDVQHAARTEGRSNYTLRKLIRLWLNMLTNFTILPLRFAVYLGGFTVLFGLTLTTLVLYWTFTGVLLPEGWPSVMCSLVIFSGVQLITLGVIGEYVGRLFLSYNGTPQFVVREVVSKGGGESTPFPGDCSPS